MEWMELAGSMPKSDRDLRGDAGARGVGGWVARGH